ncbi:transcription factor 21-like protein [Lates japonicus]|uniref:Transcription factor 21-like protein n=1 Tax=Lates japonicus TaxID=270547 RepID=A0AAD3MXI9_LATJO|nr:transcription factor 21-like protein [Lates japonicus]
MAFSRRDAASSNAGVSVDRHVPGKLPECVSAAGIMRQTVRSAEEARRATLAPETPASQPTPGRRRMRPEPAFDRLRRHPSLEKARRSCPCDTLKWRRSTSHRGCRAPGGVVQSVWLPVQAQRTRPPGRSLIHSLGLQPVSRTLSYSGPTSDLGSNKSTASSHSSSDGIIASQ